jgi:hypothetical protein
MRSAWAWTLIGLSVVLAVPAMLVMFLAEKLGDYADEWID